MKKLIYIIAFMKLISCSNQDSVIENQETFVDQGIRVFERFYYLLHPRLMRAYAATTCIFQPTLEPCFEHLGQEICLTLVFSPVNLQVELTRWAADL